MSEDMHAGQAATIALSHTDPHHGHGSGQMVPTESRGDPMLHPHPTRREAVPQATNAQVPVLLSKYPTIAEEADTPSRQHSLVK